VSVLFEGSRFPHLPAKPNFSGYINSGAIHRIVPLIPRLSPVLPAVDSSMITASPKSAKRARQSESIKMFAYSYSAPGSTIRSVQPTHPFEISVDDVMLMQVLQPRYRVNELPTNDQYCRREVTSHPLTRRRRLWFGRALTKFVIFPFSIRSETIEKSGGVSVTPTNGRMFSCWSHFQPTTSLTRSLESSVSDHFKQLWDLDAYSM
jgi:hypothetical protein